MAPQAKKLINVFLDMQVQMAKAMMPYLNEPKTPGLIIEASLILEQIMQQNRNLYPDLIPPSLEMKHIPDPEHSDRLNFHLQGPEYFMTWFRAEQARFLRGERPIE